MTSVTDLRPSQRDISMTVQVVEIKSGAVGTKDALVGDETGCVTFISRHDLGDKVEVGNYLKLSDVRVDMFRGSMRLAATKKSTAEVCEASFKPKTDLNVSLIEWEMVNIKAVTQSQAAPVGEEAPAANGSSAEADAAPEMEAELAGVQ